MRNKCEAEFKKKSMKFVKVFENSVLGCIPAKCSKICVIYGQSVQLDMYAMCLF